MLTKEAQIKGNKVATQRLREKAINSIGKEAVQAILEYRRDGVTLREIADRLNHRGYRTMTGKEFQQAQVKRTLDRIKKNPSLIDDVTDLIDNVTTDTITETVTDKRLEALQAELDKYKVMVESLDEDNERLRQTGIEQETLKNKLKEVLKPFQAILENTNNPNQPRLQKLNEVVKAIKSVIDI